MDTTPLASLSLAQAMRLELDLLANNMASASTAGFKGEKILFETQIQRAPADSPREDVNFISYKGSYIDEANGETVPTGNPLDVAVQGGWLTYRAADGSMAIGRDGRFLMDGNGQLTTASGAVVLDTGGAPILLPPGGVDGVKISKDGTVSAGDGTVVGRLGIVQIDQVDGFERMSGALFRLPANAAAPVPALLAEVTQGAIEQSNVKPVLEMTRMMTIQSAYDRAQKIISDDDDLKKNFLQRIGRVA